MILDKEQDRSILIHALKKTEFPGEFSEEITGLKKAVAEAKVTIAGKDRDSPKDQKQRMRNKSVQPTAKE